MSTWRDRIASDPNVLHGRPCIRATRVPVSVIVGSLGGGMTFIEIQDEYGVTEDDIRAALSFAAELAAGESVHPLSA